MDDLARRPHLFPHRFPQPFVCLSPVGVDLSDLQGQCPVNHRIAGTSRLEGGEGSQPRSPRPWFTKDLIRAALCVELKYFATGFSGWRIDRASAQRRAWSHPLAELLSAC